MGRTKMTYRSIGVIHTPFTEIERTPINGIFAPEAKGRVEVFPEFAAGLRDIKGFSHLILIYHFHLAEGYSLIVKPFLDNEEKGVFAVRHFKRPNPIGISIVKLDRVQGNVLEISSIDIIDGTLLLDIKPYIAKFDSKSDVKDGWADNPRLKGVTNKNWDDLQSEGFEW